MVITNKIHLENKRYALASGVFFISSLEKSCEIQEVSTIEPATQIQTILLLFVYMCFTVPNYYTRFEFAFKYTLFYVRHTHSSFVPSKFSFV